MIGQLREVLDDSVIVDVVRQAWRQDPVAVAVSIPVTVLAIVLIWIVLVFAIVAGTPA